MQYLQNTLAKANKESYIMGDMNINLLKFSHLSKTNEYLENNCSQVNIPLITKPTRVTNHSAILIDHIYANKLQITTTSGILSLMSQTTSAFLQSSNICQPNPQV